METKRLFNLRKTTKQRLDLKKQTPDWAGYLEKPPALRRKTGIATGMGLAERPAPGLTTDCATKWITRYSRFAASTRAGGTVGKPVPQRQAGRPEPVMKCADGGCYRKVKTNEVGKAQGIALPSAHDLAKSGSFDLDPNMLVTWLGIIAHGKTVHGKDDNAVTRFDAASRAMSASAAFTDDFSSKHCRIVKEFKRVAETTGPKWSIAEPDAKNRAATSVATTDQFRQFLLSALRKPRIAGVDWSLGYVDKKKTLDDKIWEAAVRCEESQRYTACHNAAVSCRTLIRIDKSPAR